MRHAVAVPLPPLKLASSGAQAASPATTTTGEPGGGGGGAASNTISGLLVPSRLSKVRDAVLVVVSANEYRPLAVTLEVTS